jgi:Lon protease-like protein
MERLPQSVPIFPLPDVVLFPEVRLPLHIFEPRYRAMIEDALVGDRVIGMTLLRPGAEAVLPSAPIFEVGCAGPIVDCRRLPDGRFHLVLVGTRRFRIDGDRLTDRGYRMAQIEPLQDAPYEELDAATRGALDARRGDVERLMLELTRLVSPDSVRLLRERIAALDSLSLVHMIAFGIDSPPLEKQGLLEASSPVQRCGLLIQLLEFRLAELRVPRTPQNVN